MSLKIANSYECSLKKLTICTVKPNGETTKVLSRRGSSRNVIEVKFNGTENEVFNLDESNFPFCKRFKKLENFYITDISSIDENLFHNCVNMDVLWIMSKDLMEIPENLFYHSSKLLELKLEGNEFSTLPVNFFAQQHDLEILSLYNNKISSLPSNIFKSLLKLTWLSISTNKLDSLNKNWFWNLNNLKNLDLSYNKIMDLPRNIFRNLGSLEQLQLYSNQLTTIHSDSFGMHESLRIFRLSNNEIDSFDPDLVENMVNATVFMDGNYCSDGVILLSRDVDEILKNCFDNYKERKQVSRVEENCQQQLQTIFF